MTGATACRQVGDQGLAGDWGDQTTFDPITRPRASDSDERNVGKERKLVMICYGVLKNRKPFDPNWAAKIVS